MTRLLSLELRNFRSHKETLIEFDDRPVVVTGKNGAGKTNLLEALSLFSPGRGLRRASRDEFARSPENLGWKLVLRLTKEGEVMEIINQAKFDENRQILVNDKASTQAEMASFLRPVWLVPAQDRLWSDSASDRRRFFDRLVLSFVPGHGEAVLKYEKAMRERNRLLKDGVQDAHWYLAIEEQMAQSARIIIKNRAQALARLNDQMAQRQSHFPQGVLSLVYEADFDKVEDMLSFWSEKRSSERFAGITKYGAHKLDFDAVFSSKNMRAAVCSTGEQKALLVSLILANAQALIEDGAFVVMLLDEIAAHLDEERRGHLFDELCALDAQVLMTGTETELFEALGERGQYIRIYEDNLVSRVE